MKNKPILTLIRGLPGSGKSTIARALSAMSGAEHLEADQFFVGPNGYEFDPRRIRQAHDWCIAETKAALDHGHDVVVSNTFSQMWEMAPYLHIDEVVINVIEAKGQFKSIHDVPENKIQLMRERWEEY